MSELCMDVVHRSVNRAGEHICGDSVVVVRPAGGRRTLAVLSDGMGSGMKASVLSTLTSSMLSTLVRRGGDISQIASMVLGALPVCSVRKISYSTFTIVDMDQTTCRVSIAEYDNPRIIILRGGKPLPLEWIETDVPSASGRRQTIRSANFTAQPGDTLAAVTDGVTQSGQAAAKYRFGWGEKNLAEFVQYVCAHNTGISVDDIARQVLSKACMNDDQHPSDDMTCMVARVRPTTRMMLISCPPALREDHDRLARHVAAFKGEKAILGYHVADILAFQLGLKVREDERSDDPSLPPAWHIDGFEYVTDGLVTSGRVLNSLESSPAATTGRSRANRLARALAGADHIEFVIGTMRAPGRNEDRPDEFELRRSILVRIAELLETKFGSQVTLTYI